MHALLGFFVFVLLGSSAALALEGHATLAACLMTAAVGAFYVAG